MVSIAYFYVQNMGKYSVTELTSISAQAFTSTLGVNTHIDFQAYGYQDLATVESALSYLGVSNVRDSAANSYDLTAWQQVAQATGVKFDDFLPQVSPAAMQDALALMPQLAQEGILNFVEGGDEEDDSLPAAVGNSLWNSAQVQQQVYAMGQELGLPVINMSFGAGWTAANGWQGDYGLVGDLSAIADYGNVHIYPNPGQTPDDAIQQLNALSPLAASGRPVIATEIGWSSSSFNEGNIAQYVVDAAFDGIKDGDASMYYYALFNDMSGNYGLMNSDGSPTAAGTALHDLTTLLADTGSAGSGALDVSLSGNVDADNTLLIQKSDGSDWLALWDETADTHGVTVTLDSNAQQILVFDPVTGTSAIDGADNTNSITVSLGQDPLLIEVIPGGGTTASAAVADSGTTAPAAAPAAPDSQPASGPDPVVNVPSGLTGTADGGTAIGGVSISDAWADQNPGSLSLTVTASDGTLSMTSGGAALSGSGTNTIVDSGSLAQINADLATLTYSGSGSGSVDLDVWDQAGVEASQSFNLQSSGSADTVAATAASGGDTMQFAGSGNVIDAVAGASIEDDGTNNTIVLPATGEADIYGNTLANGDVFDLSALLAQTAWDGSASTLQDFLAVHTDGTNGQLTVNPSGVAGGDSYTAAVFEASGRMNLSTLLAHAIT
jgi:hypothetical protein